MIGAETAAFDNPLLWFFDAYLTYAIQLGLSLVMGFFMLTSIPIVHAYDVQRSSSDDPVGKT
ncbi:MAG: hypothetical protein HXS50_00925 [Theionarchaea archaeon]|nr:hypothetical protein [Theionarchaea archaeon]